jgi:hypothetical protein
VSNLVDVAIGVDPFKSVTSFTAICAGDIIVRKTLHRHLVCGDSFPESASIAYEKSDPIIFNISPSSHTGVMARNALVFEHPVRYDTPSVSTTRYQI